MVLTDPQEIALAKSRLMDSEKARHLLMTGRAVARFRDQNGEEVQYSKSDLPRLEAYILELKGLLGIRDTSGQGPMRVLFG